MNIFLPKISIQYLIWRIHTYQTLWICQNYFHFLLPVAETTRQISNFPGRDTFLQAIRTKSERNEIALHTLGKQTHHITCTRFSSIYILCLSLDEYWRESIPGRYLSCRSNLVSITADLILIHTFIHLFHSITYCSLYFLQSNNLTYSLCLTCFLLLLKEKTDSNDLPCFIQISNFYFPIRDKYLQIFIDIWHKEYVIYWYGRLLIFYIINN